jgi:hypothetical protein
MSHRYSSGFFTRTDVARIFGVHLTTVRRWENKKKNPLPWVLDANGIHRFPRDVILAKATEAGRLGGVPGSIAGHLFELFAEGMDWREAATKTKVHPKQVEALFDLYWTEDPDHNDDARTAIKRRDSAEATAETARTERATNAEPSRMLAWQRKNEEALRQIRDENERVQREWEEARAQSEDAPPQSERSRLGGRRSPR